MLDLSLKDWVYIFIVASGLIGLFWRQGIHYGRLISRLEAVEECKKRVEENALLTIEDYEKRETSCRLGVSKEIELLRKESKSHERIMDKREERREEERKEDEVRSRNMEKSINKVTTILEVFVIPYVQQDVKNKENRN